MFKNYLKLAVRNLIKFKKFSIINILGLAIGLTSFIIIMLWVQHELSYDQFHKNYDQIYVALRENTSAATSLKLAPIIKDEIPEVIEATSLVNLPKSIKLLLKYQNKDFEENFNLVDQHFFDIFSFDFIDGNQQSALLDPNSLVLTENMAKKYFGDNNALGKSIHMTLLGKTNTLKVTGILKNIPGNSYIQQEIFIPLSYVKKLLEGTGEKYWGTWQNRSARTFILTQPRVDISAVEQKIADCERKHVSYQNLENLEYSLFPLKKIHLHANKIESLTSTGDVKYVYIFTVIAVIILLIACMNYMNLSNALSLKQIKEIGIQKVMGAQRIHLIGQYFGEALIMTFFALGCAVVFVELLLPVFGRLTEKSLSVFQLNSQFLILIFLTAIITSIISGLYPAIIISGFQPIQLFKSKLNVGKKGINLRKGLIICQFSLSIIIIICTIVVFIQLNFIENSNLGYDKENVLCLRVKGDISNQYNTFKNRILKNRDIISICRSEPIDINSLSYTEGIRWPERNEGFQSWIMHCDCDLAATYNIDMLKGRFFSEQFPTDKSNAFVLNQAAVKAMELQSPIGQEIEVVERKGRIIGIIKNFHFNSFHHKVEPLIMKIPDTAQQALYYRELSIRFKPNSLNQSLAFLKNQWQLLFPLEQFNYYFVDEKLNAGYRIEQRTGDLFNYFSILALFLTCLGLYGLTALTIEQKIKEIGIHKVLGATVSNIVLLLSKNYFRWILLSNLIAWPIAYYAMNKWLQNFAYRIDISWWIFILAGAIVMMLALFTVSFQAIKAATVNPVDSLRNE